MIVKVSLLGIIGEYAGHTSLDMDVKNGATVGDLLGEIGDRYGGRMPPDLWDPVERAFSPMVSVFLDGEDVGDDKTPLREGSEVILLSMMAGGKG